MCEYLFIQYSVRHAKTSAASFKQTDIVSFCPDGPNVSQTVPRRTTVQVGCAPNMIVGELPHVTVPSALILCTDWFPTEQSAGLTIVATLPASSTVWATLAVALKKSDVAPKVDAPC